MLTWIGRRCVDAVMAVIVAAAVVKLIDLQEFEVTVRGWSLIPSQFAWSIALSVPLLELVIGLLWFLRLARGEAAVAAAVLLVAFSTVAAAHLAFAEVPRCGCFGQWDRFYQAADEGWALLARNGMLLSVLLIGGAVVRGFEFPRKIDPTCGEGAPHGRGAVGRGFTLVETLMSVGLVALLVALLLPSLAGVRERARDAASLSNMRSHAAIFAVYATDSKDRFPYFTYPGATYSVVRALGRERSVQVPYFGAHAVWNIALADGYYGGNYDERSFYPPSYLSGLGGKSYFTPYSYGCVFIAAPSFWDPPSRQTGTAQLRATRMSDVTFPSRKALLVNNQDAYLRHGEGAIPDWSVRRLEPVELALVDGGSRAVPRGDVLPGHQQGEWPAPGTMHPADGPEGGLHTIDGVRGRDLR